MTLESSEQRYREILQRIFTHPSIHQLLFPYIVGAAACFTLVGRWRDVYQILGEGTWKKLKKDCQKIRYNFFLMDDHRKELAWEVLDWIFIYAWGLFLLIVCLTKIGIEHQVGVRLRNELRPVYRRYILNMD